MNSVWTWVKTLLLQMLKSSTTLKKWSLGSVLPYFSLSLSLSVFLSFCLSFSLSLSLSFSLSFLSLSLSIYLSLFLSFYLYIYRSILKSLHSLFYCNIFKIMTPDSERRNSTAMYNPMSLAEIKESVHELFKEYMHIILGSFYDNRNLEIILSLWHYQKQ